MPVDLAPSTEKRLRELAVQSGRDASEIAEDTLAGYLDEFTALRSTLDRRYDEIKSGKVQLIDGEEARRQVKAKPKSDRSRHGY